MRSGVGSQPAGETNRTLLSTRDRRVELRAAARTASTVAVRQDFLRLTETDASRLQELMQTT